MMGVINVAKFVTSANSNVLDDTELETAPGVGTFMVRAASTVNTATIRVAGESTSGKVKLRSILHRANAEVRSTDSAWVVTVTSGARVEVEIGGTTGTVMIQVTYIGAV